MEAYPEDYVDHNLPLLLLCGLEHGSTTESIANDRTRTYLGEGGFRIRAEFPLVEGPVAEALRKTLLNHDSSSSAWRSHIQEKGSQKFAFKIKSVGRTYTLPPRKAPPPPHAPRLSPTDDNGTLPTPLVLHSTLSPLTPSSPLYPDGLFTPLWITKHQTRLPSTLISFYTLSADKKSSSLLDNEIKSEIHNIRNIINSTHYKTRFVVVLIGNDTIDQNEIEERLVNIRRAANLDAKSLFFLPHAVSSAEISDFVSSLLLGLYSSSIEYYRDLSKHARRKRNRNSAPQPTVLPTSGNSAILTLASWNVRYEFKLGVFAEFRQEMEAACRNYETAYEGLFGSEVLEAISPRSTRFNEARMFADVIAIRIIRCMLWSSQTATATQWHITHRNRIHDFLNRRGHGTDDHTWDAWQCSWSKTMASLIERSEVFTVVKPGPSSTAKSSIYVRPEKGSAETNRVSPWENLHHQGYWLNIAQRFIQDRQKHAKQSFEEGRDTVSSGASTDRAFKSSTYLVQDPETESSVGSRGEYSYTEDIVETLDAAINLFQTKEQLRMVQVLKLKKASEYLRATLWEKAVVILRPLWINNSWHGGGWWILFSQIGRALLKCAVEMEDSLLVSELIWSLSNPVLKIKPTLSSLKPGSMIEQTDNNIQTAVDPSVNLSNVSAQFSFATAEGHVGEQVQAQLSLSLLGSTDFSGLEVTEMKVVFEGGIKPILLIAEDSTNKPEILTKAWMTNVDLSESLPKDSNASKRSSLTNLPSWTGRTDMSIAPGCSRIWNLTVTPREAGHASVSSINVVLTKNQEHHTVTMTSFLDSTPAWWEMRSGKAISRMIGSNRDVSAINVLPKPPKLHFDAPNAPKAYYTNEDLFIDLRVINNEDAPVQGTLDVRLISPQKTGITILHLNNETSANSSVGANNKEVQTLQQKNVAQIGVGGNTTYPFTLTNSTDAIDHELEAIMTYTLSSDPDTSLMKTFVLDIPVIRPFEANIQFHPRLHKETWPNFFNPPQINSSDITASGLKCQYFVVATVASFALERLVIRSVTLIPNKIVGDAICSASKGQVRKTQPTGQLDEARQYATSIDQEQSTQFTFDITIQKSNLGDRQPVSTDFMLEIVWTRQEGAKENISTLALPKFLAPVCEPRVLLEVSKPDGLDGLYQLLYTLENPSMHFLTFNITMESGESFAFSGTKSRTASLVPISRLELRYQILPYVKNEWIKVRLEVVDAYFGQTLKVQPACDGVKIDKEGNVLVHID